MWSLSKIKFENLGSFQEAEYIFNKGKCTLIQGINLSDKGQKSNGAGKSIITEAIIIGLLGETFRKIRLIELIRDGTDKAFVELWFYNTISQDNFYIKRTLFIKGSPKIELKLNKVEKNLSGIEEYNKFILDQFGISRNDFLSYYVIHKEKFTPFLLMTDTQKKEFILKFSRVDIIKEGIKKLENDLLITINQVAIINIELIKDRETLLIYNTEKDTLIKNEAELKIEKLKIINDSIDEKKKDIDILIAGRHIYEKQIRQIESEIRIFKNKKLLDIYTQSGIDLKQALKEHLEVLIQTKKIKDDFEKNISQLKNNIRSLDQKIKNIVTCPKCDYIFSLEGDLVKLKKEKSEIEKRLVVQNEALEVQEEQCILDEELKKEIEDALDNLRKKLIQFKAIQESNKLQIKNKENYIKNAQDTIKIANNSIQKKQSEIAFKIVESKHLNESSSLDLSTVAIKISNLENLIKDNEDNLIYQTNEKLQIETWINIFKRFLNYVSNKTLNTISYYTNWYLEKFDSGLTVILNGFKYLADGKTIREEIDVDIYRDGIKKGSFGRFSSGEKIRLIIANILALQKILNLASNKGGLDLLILDEIIESVDSEGTENIVKVLNSINQTINIVTFAYHDVSNIESVIVIKENGISTIKI